MSASSSPTVGILYCGNLGAALGRCLIRSGGRVVTTVEGRSTRTKDRAADAGVEILPTLDEVVRVADVLLSVVLPDAAEEVARACATRAHLAPKNGCFVDLNSLDPALVLSIRDMIEQAGIRFVDGAIHGGAERLEEMGALYLSGPHAEEVEPLFRSLRRVLLLGEEIGQATRMKLLMAGMSKSLNILFLQMAIIADKADMLNPFLEESRAFYPEIMTAIERMLPTYPEHALRRVTELQGIESLAQSVEAPHQIIRAARELLQAVAESWGTDSPTSIPEIIRSAQSTGDTT